MENQEGMQEEERDTGAVDETEEERQKNQSEVEARTEEDMREIQKNQSEEKAKAGIDEARERKEFSIYLQKSIKTSKRLEAGKYLIPYATAFYSAQGKNPSEITKFLNTLDRSKLGGYGVYLDKAEVESKDTVETTEEEKKVFQNMLVGIATVEKLVDILATKLHKETIKEDVERIQEAGIGFLPYWDIDLVTLTMRDKEKADMGYRIKTLKLEQEEVPNEIELLRRIWKYHKELPEEEVVEKKLTGISEMKQREIKDAEEIAQDVNFVVTSDVQNIVDLLDAIYGTVKKGEVVGVIAPEQGNESDIKMYDIRGESRLTQYTEFFTSLYATYEVSVLNGVVGGIGSIDDTVLRLTNKYNPGWHLENIQIDAAGKTEWETSIKDQFKGYCTKILVAEHSKPGSSKIDKEKGNSPYKAYVEEITKRITSVIFLKQINGNTMLFRMGGVANGKSNEVAETTKKFEDRYKQELGAYFSNMDGMRIGACRTGMNSVTYLSLIYNLAHFEDEMLFGYKRIEELEVFNADISEVVLGLGIDGEPVTVNLVDSAGKMTQIMAGSRSGKGVMTMSFMSTIQAAGGNIVYLDGKPDIGAMLWKLEDQIKEEEGVDVRFLSMDTQLDKSAFNGAVPKRYEAETYREGLTAGAIGGVPSLDSWKAMRLVKLLQLTDLLKEFQETHPEKAIRGPIFLVIDEIKVISLALADIQDYIKGDIGPQERKKNPVDAEYRSRMKQLYEETANTITKGIAAHWATLGVRVIMIGQEYNSQWGVSEISSRLLGSVTRTIAGKHQVSKQNTIMSEDQYDLIGAGADTNKGRGMFVLSDTKMGPPVSSGSLTNRGIPTLADNNTLKNPAFFRSYFTLIDNDIDVERYEEAKESGNLTGYWGETGDNFTTEMMMNMGPETGKKYRTAEKDLYNLETKEVNKKVGYKGLLDVVIDKTGQDRVEFYENLNRGYDRYANMFAELQPYMPYEYNSVEEYIADLRVGSIFTNMELTDMLYGRVPEPTREDNMEGEGGFQADIDIFAGLSTGAEGNEVEETGQGEYEEGYEEEYDVIPEGEYGDEAGYEGEQEEGTGYEDTGYEDTGYEDTGYEDTGYEDIGEYEKEGYTEDKEQGSNPEEEVRGTKEERKEQKTRTEKAKNPEKRRNEKRVMESRIVVPDSKNPFLMYAGNGNIATVNKKIDMSRIILDDLGKQMGGLSNITEFRINGDKTITVNGVGYKPSFDLDFLKTIAPYQREEVREGGVGGFVYFKHVLSEMPRLTTIELEPKEIGESSALQEIGYRYVSDYKKLFKKMNYLTKIVICGEEITPETEVEREESSQGFGLGSKIARMFNFGGKRSESKGTPNPLGEQMLDNVVNSAPARIMGTALGWTVGVKATIWMASMMGPFGLLFGALAMGGAYNESKNRR